MMKIIREIIIEDYNPKWAEEFKKLKQVYLTKLEDINVDIQHVGSTSVKGLSAKPIIDIDIIVDNEEELNKVIQFLDELGYIHMGNLGIKGREAFKRRSGKVPYKIGVDKWYSHNLYVCIRGCISLENHLRFRDYLRKNPDAVIKYGNLKKELSIKYKYDIDSYIEKKTAFITDILNKSGISKQDIDEIKNMNKKS